MLLAFMVKLVKLHVVNVKTYFPASKTHQNSRRENQSSNSD